MEGWTSSGTMEERGKEGVRGRGGGGVRRGEWGGERERRGGVGEKQPVTHVHLMNLCL